MADRNDTVADRDRTISARDRTITEHDVLSFVSKIAFSIVVPLFIWFIVGTHNQITKLVELQNSLVTDVAVIKERLKDK